MKVRGFRIELGEIENQLVKHETVKEAVVIAKEKEKEENYLCAYFVPYHDKVREEIPSPILLKEFLAHTLPDYMIPVYFIPVEKIPLTANGKIDLNALPAVEIGSGGKYAAPTNEIERILVKLWREILNPRIP